MNIIFLLIIISMTVAGSFLWLFIWATRSGQYDDTYTPSVRMLFDDKKKKSCVDEKTKVVNNEFSTKP